MIPPIKDNPPQQYTVSLGQKGRLVLPAEARRQLGFEEGDRLVLTVEADGSMRLISARRLAHDLQGMLQDLQPTHSWTEALLQERRAESRQETGQ